VSRREPLGPVAVSIAGKSAEAITLVLLVTLVPRELGPSDYGVFAVALAAVALASAAMLPFGPALHSRFIPAAAPADRAGLALALTARLLRLRALQVTVFAAGAFALAVGLPEHFPAGPTVLVTLAVALDAAATLGFQAAIGLGYTGLWSFRYPLQNTLLVAAALPLHEVWGATGAVAAIPLAAAGALVAGGVVTARALRRVGRPDGLPPGVMRFAVVQSAADLFLLVGHRAPVLAVALLADSRTEAGFTALAAGVGLAATYAVWQAFYVELPRLSAGAAADPAGAEAAARSLAARAALVLIPAVLAGALVLDSLLPALVGERFRGVDAALGPALAVVPLAALTALVNQVAALRLRPGARLWASAAGAAAFVVTALVAVPRWESVGGTLALLAATAVTVSVSPALLPGVFGFRLLAASGAGSAAVLALSALT
jgi:hypothetical protein